MPIIEVQPGEVYEFTTISGSSNVIAQFAGTSDVFTRDIYGTMRFTGSFSRLQIENDADINIKGNLIYSEGSFISIDWYPLNTDLHPTGTSSLGTAAEWSHTGSFIRIIGSADHRIEFNGAIVFDPYLRIVRRDNSTGRITIAASDISGQPTWSCVDPFCSIEVANIQANNVILSEYKNWT